MLQQAIAQRIRDMGHDPEAPVTSLGVGVIFFELTQHLHSAFTLNDQALSENSTPTATLRSETQEALVKKKGEIDERMQNIKSEIEDHELKLCEHNATAAQSVEQVKLQMTRATEMEAQF